LQGRSTTAFDLHVFWKYLFDPAIRDGARITVELAVLSQAAGIVIGLFAALGRLSRLRLPVFRAIAFLYIWLFRGTPLLVQLAFVYFAVPQMTNGRIVLGEFMSGFIGLSLNEGAYMAEIIRAGIMSVEAGQMEAAQSLGMTRALAMRRIVIPQAVRFIIPPTGNEFISMLKNTSLAYSIAVAEIFYQATQIYSGNGRYFELLTVVSLWYLAMTTVATFGQTLLERRFERGFTRTVRGPGAMQRAMMGAFRRG
jgi:polar amino acid transport system permease protein